MTIGHDTVLYRSGANVLSTDDRFGITLDDGKRTLHLSNTTANVGMTIGHDTVLYRSGANVLSTDDRFGITLDDGKYTLHLTNDAANVGLTIGSDSNRVELYKISGNALATDDLFAITVNSGKNTLHLNNTTVGIGMTIGQDTNLYRSGVDTLRTDDNLGVVLNFNVDGNTILGDATSDTVTFNARANSNLEPSSNNTRNLGSSALNWGTAFVNTLEVAANSTLTGDLSVQGNTTLGNATSDTVTFTARAASELTPSTNNTRNLGSSALNWGTAFVNTLQVAANSTLTGSLSVQGDTTLGSDANDTVTINAGPVNLPSATSAGDGLVFSTDVVLYRSAANTLTVDDNFIINFNGGKTTLALTNTTADVGLTIGADTNLYRSAANTLKTDDSFIVGAYAISSINATLAAAGTTQAVASVISTDISNVTSSSPTASGVLLPTAIAGMKLGILNNSTNTINIYPAVGAQINALTTNVPLTLTVGSKTTLVATTTTQWYSI
jgi:hypothetical protein